VGFVAKSELDKRTNQYELTDAGYAAVVDEVRWSLQRIVTGDDRAEEVRTIVDDALPQS